MCFCVHRFLCVCLYICIYYYIWDLGLVFVYMCFFAKNLLMDFMWISAYRLFCMNLCLGLRRWLCAYVQMFTYTKVDPNIYWYFTMYICVLVSISKYILVCIFPWWKWICVSVLVHVCLHVCVCAFCKRLCMHLHVGV